MISYTAQYKSSITHKWVDIRPLPVIESSNIYEATGQLWELLRLQIKKKGMNMRDIPDNELRLQEVMT